MPGKAPPRHFVGHQMVATVHQLDEFVRKAKSDERFVYCEARDLIRGDTSDHVGELRRQGLVIPFQERRPGGGFRFLVVRTSYRLRVHDPKREAMTDAGTAAVFRRLERAANLSAKCPSDAELARDCGLSTRNQAQWRVRRLAAVGLIESTLAYENGVPTRVVKILATGETTRLPERWAAMAASEVVDDLRRGGGV